MIKTDKVMSKEELDYLKNDVMITNITYINKEIDKLKSNSLVSGKSNLAAIPLELITSWIRIRNFHPFSWQWAIRLYPS